MRQPKSPVPVGRCTSCGLSLTGKFALRNHQCPAGPRVSRVDGLALQRKARQS